MPLAYKASNHIQSLAQRSKAVHKQFIATPKQRLKLEKIMSDPLLEEEFTVVKGLVYKYGNRALVLLTMNCAAYCRFCTRQRKVSDIKKGIITEKDLDNIVGYIKKHKKIKELIISGGDPLTVPDILDRALQKFSNLPQIKIIRIGSRLPVSNPKMINKKILGALKNVKRQPLYLMLHFEHPDELTTETICAVKKLQTVSSMMFSQSVFLKGVNDSYTALKKLFSGLIEIGIKPYYIYHCDPVRGAEHFIMNIKKEIEIMTKLRKNLSGLAFPIHVIDTPNGSGKIPVPNNFWKFDYKQFKDFNDSKIKMY